MKILVKNTAAMYCIFENDKGDCFLEVVKGGIAMESVTIRMNSKEVQSFREQGEVFVSQLARDLAKDEAKYRDRMVEEMDWLG